jgi:hypothetical protein
MAIREPVIDAATTEPAIKADGGKTVEAGESDHFDERPDDCDFTLAMEGIQWWACYHDGFEVPNPCAEVVDE